MKTVNLGRERGTAMREIVATRHLVPWIFLIGLFLLFTNAAHAQPYPVPPTWGGDMLDRPRLKEIVEQTHRLPLSNVSAFNRFGLPALTLPCGFSRDGLPIGLQVVGPYFGESVVLATAFAYQQSTEWHMKHPGD